MALPLISETLEALPEAHRALYVARDGKFHLDVTGLEDTSGLKSALERQKEDNKTAKAALAKLAKDYEGIDPVATKAMLARAATDVEAKLIAEGKLDEVVAMRLDKMRGEFEKQTSAATEKATKYSQKVLDNHILAAAAKVGLHKHAIDDALLRGRSLFTLTDDGDAVKLGADGKPIYGKDGKSLYSASDWLEESKEFAPHWHPHGGNGGGANGANGGGGGEKNSNIAAIKSPTDRITAARAAGITT